MTAAPTALPFHAPEAVPCVLPTLWPCLQLVPDPRQARGRRHSLPAMLALLCVSFLCGARGCQTVAEWGRNHSGDLMRELGFPSGKGPCGSTLHYLLKRLDWKAFSRELERWAERVLTVMTHESSETGPVALAIDGKTQRGSRTQGADLTHILSLVSHLAGVTLTHLPLTSVGQEAEGARELLDDPRISGRIVTCDAGFTTRELAEEITHAGGDYVMTVKKNQPILRDTIEDLFAPVWAAEQDRDSVCTYDQAHGRIEERRLTTLSVRPEEVNWPGAAQVFVVVRQTRRGRVGRRRSTHAVVYGITSLGREKANAANLLTLNRGHWSIENRAHWPRDVLFGEDASQVATGRIVPLLVWFRSLAMNLLRGNQERSMAAATRRIAARPWEALRLLGIVPDN